MTHALARLDEPIYDLAHLSRDMLRGANLYTEHSVSIENGPGKHAIGQTFFLYAYEPGGNRIELCAGGYQIMAPDWQPVRWTEAGRAHGSELPHLWDARARCARLQWQGRWLMYPNAHHDNDEDKHGLIFRARHRV